MSVCKWANPKYAARFQSLLCFVQLRTSLASFLKCFPRQGALVRSGRKQSPFCLELLPEPSPQSLAAPNPCLASPHAFISCPASFASFLKQLIWAPPLSPCSASQFFSWAVPPVPSCPSTGPRHWHWPPGPPVAWPFLSLFWALPKSTITSNHFSILLTQGCHCPLHKGGPTVFTP